MIRAYFDVPDGVVACAVKLRQYFDERNIKDWALDGIGRLPSGPQRECQKLRELCAAAYQAAGAYDLPERFLDALSDGATGNVEERQKTDSLLPCEPPKVRQRFKLESIDEYLERGGPDPRPIISE